MKFTKLIINNFLTIGNASVELDDRGLLLIQGVNNDDPSAESNGAGKSSIVDALCWALYGVTARGVTGDAVVNKTAKKDCSVFVVIEDGGETYKVERFRKHSSHKNQLFAWRIPDPTGKVIDLSKGTDKETQEVVTQIVGCSLDVFMSAIYAGQEKMPDLPGMTDKMLKTLIEEAAGVEVLAQAYAVARNRHTVAKSALDIAATKQTTAIAADVTMRTTLANQEAESATFESGRRDRAKAELAQVLPINAEIQKTEQALKTWDEAAARKELDECAAKIDAQKAEQTELDSLNRKTASEERHAASLKTQLDIGKSKLQAEEKALADIDGHVGKPCGECGKVYHAEDLDAARKARAAMIDNVKQSLRPIVAAYREAVEHANTAREAAEKFKAGMTDVSAVAMRQRELSNLLNAIDAAKRKIEGHKRDIEAIKARANVKLTETNPWTKAIEAKKDEIGRNAKVIDETTAEVKRLEAEVELLADAVKVFGPAGVRAHILDTVTPYLNDRTQDYLGALADGNIHAVWSTLSKTAKGELREKFNIEVANDKGAESFAGLSGGEKRKVRLATAMALQDMVASRATKPIDLFIADEVDHALDESGLERLMGVLERKAKERGTVLVISHNSLGDWVDNVITVTKTSGMATASGANERGF